MNTPLEDQVERALHRQADPLQRTPFTLGDVRTRARRIRRRRTMAAGAAVAAVIAVAVPFGVSVVGDPRSSEVPPATRPPAPTSTSPAPTSPATPRGTVKIDPRSAEVVDSTTVPLLDAGGPSLVTAGDTASLPGPFSSLTPFRDGWVGVAIGDTGGTIELLTADLEPDDGGTPTGGLVVSPDGTQVAWSEYDGTRWQLVRADAHVTDRDYTAFPPSTQDERVEPVGFLDEDRVVVRSYDNDGTVATWAAGGGETAEVPGLLQADAAAAATGMVAGLSELRLGASCSAVVGGLARTGSPVWDTCDYRLGPFSPDGSLVVGTDAEADAEGSPTLALLDAATGKVVVDFEVVAGPREVVGVSSPMAWEDDDALVVRVAKGGDFSLMRLGVDGTVQRIETPGGADGLRVAEVR